NPTHHPYFNLAGDRTVPAAAQWLQVPASHYLPVVGELIPFGEVAPVAGTPFDFRIARGLAIAAPHPQLEAGGGLDHCLVLDPGRGFTAALYSPHSGLAMRIDSDAPGLQLYGGQGLARQHPGLGDGICLEPQDYPDAPNRPAFPPAILAPGRAYRRGIRYRFARPGRDRGWDGVAHALRLGPPGLGSPSRAPAQPDVRGPAPVRSFPRHPRRPPDAWRYPTPRTNPAASANRRPTRAWPGAAFSSPAAAAASAPRWWRRSRARARGSRSS